MSLLQFNGTAPNEGPKVTAPIPHAVVVEWTESKRALDAAKDEEIKQRLAIVNTFFADGKSEGGATKIMDDGRRVAATKVLNRTIDVALLQTLADQLREKGIVLDAVIKYRPEVVISEYRKLTDEQRMFFDQILTITDGTPQLEMRTPKNWTPPE